jgi:hypothetical protein
MLCWVVTEQPRDEGDGDAMRFQMAGRQVDDETLDLTTTDRLELGRDDFDMWRKVQLSIRVQFIETALDKARKILPEDQG